TGLRRRGPRAAAGGPPVGRGDRAGVSAARRLPGRAGRTTPTGPRPRRHAGPGERARRDVGPDPAPVRVRRLQRGALLLVAGRVTNAWLCPGAGHVVMPA